MDHRATHAPCLPLLTRLNNEGSFNVGHQSGDVGRQLACGLGELPIYNEDIDSTADLPVSASTLRGAVADADAILVVTPEYNGSIPGGLKNAIDWLSRPYGPTMRPASHSGSPGPTLSMRPHSVPIDTLGGKPPRDNDDVAAGLNDVLTKLAAHAS